MRNGIREFEYQKVAVLKLLLSIKIYGVLLNFHTKHLRKKHQDQLVNVTSFSFCVLCLRVNILKYAFLYTTRARDPTKIDMSVIEIKPLTVVTIEDMCNVRNIALMF